MLLLGILCADRPATCMQAVPKQHDVDRPLDAAGQHQLRHWPALAPAARRSQVPNRNCRETSPLLL